MSYDIRKRDRHRRAVAAVTSLTGVGALTITGWLMGAAADDYAAQQQVEAAAAQSADLKPAQPANRAARADSARRDLPRQRSYVTRVTVRYVTGAAPGTNPVGPGGPITPVTPAVAPAAAAPAAPAPMPAPAPPAPSTGS